MTTDQVSRCGPTNDFVPFGWEQIEQSIVQCFEEVVLRLPGCLTKA